MGTDAYEILYGEQEKFVMSKPTPNKKLRKRALTYGLVMVLRELSKHSKGKEKEISQAKEHVTQKETDNEKLNVQNSMLSAQILNQNTQINKFELKVLELSFLLGKREKESYMLTKKV